MNRSRRGGWQASRFKQWGGPLRRTLRSHFDRQQLGPVASTQSPRFIQTAPVENQVGVDSVRSRYQCYRCPLRQRRFDNPSLLFQRPVLPIRRDGMSVSVHHRSQWTLSLVSPSRACFSITLLSRRPRPYAYGLFDEVIVPSLSTNAEFHVGYNSFRDWRPLK